MHVCNLHVATYICSLIFLLGDVQEGLTPLTLALDAGRVGVSQILMAQGAKVDNADEVGNGWSSRSQSYSIVRIQARSIHSIV